MSDFDTNQSKNLIILENEITRLKNIIKDQEYKLKDYEAMITASYNIKDIPESSNNYTHEELLNLILNQSVIIIPKSFNKNNNE